MQRREFIKTTCLSCANLAIIGTVSSLILQSCNTVKYVTVLPKDNKLAIKKADFMVLKNEKTSYREWVLVKTEKAPFPIGVFRFDDNNYSALYLECTHQGCEVQPQGDHLQCPCHGAEFSNIGKVVQAPAEKDLKKFQVETDKENIYILLK